VPGTTVVRDPRAGFDFDAHARRATDRYQTVRHTYIDFTQAIYEISKGAVESKEIKVASIEARTKEIESFTKKCLKRSDNDPEAPKYSDPLSQITDLAGTRIITFFLDTIPPVESLINGEFLVVERIDKSDLLKAEEKFGYQSIHFLVRLRPEQANLPKYQPFTNLTAEIQVRTIVQHVWAEIEHDILYHSPLETVPQEIRRRLMRLAGMLEMVDEEFQAIHVDDERIRREAGMAAQASS